jgi:hypothetical protein
MNVIEKIKDDETKTLDGIPYEELSRRKYNMVIKTRHSFDMGKMTTENKPVPDDTLEHELFGSRIQQHIHTNDIVTKPEEYHLPVFDCDFEIETVPSSTPGHYHLYIDVPIEFKHYMNIMRAFVDAGLIEEGYYHACLSHGEGFVRRPGHNKKDDFVKTEKSI